MALRIFLAATLLLRVYGKDDDAGLAAPGAGQPSVAAPNAVNVPSISDMRMTNRIDLVAKGHAPRPARRIVQDYEKWGVEPPTPIVAAAASQTGTVQATNQPFDLAYYGTITIGKKKFLMNFDSGSSDLWVFSKQMPKSQQGTHAIYQDTGTQYTNPLESWSIQYVEGSGASGNVWADKVTVGGVTATVQAVEAATSVSSKLVSRVSDGILGLAFDSDNTCSPYQCFTFMHQVIPTLPLPIFTVTLRKGKPGTYDFGFIDHSEYSGKLAYTSADNSTGFWGLHPSAYQIGTAAKKSTSFFTIADTGTSYMYLPPAIAKAYYAKVPGAAINSTYNLYLYPCKSKLPNFSLFIGAHKATIPGSILRVGVFDGTTCLAGLQSDNGFPNSILGDTFLKSQFVVFDYAGPKLGFAQQAGLPAN